ncbi:hypothetical protein [Calothrix sp. UHCC 0171]|uniref:hypothetical protein n=1 Tax=Calothrix sp. UHCC 0171 TaxID=3110245 RepID=UPI002B1F9E12|nr:hypothetical protein [Calothrix sp. UHCC 0171]MEA5574507.1 hypothetical protein [Calothrix sp. UHCC 0171]
MILLDTHIWLWWLHSPDQLSEHGRKLLTIGENQNSLIVSTISVWEIAVKHSNGKLPLPFPSMNGLHLPKLDLELP